MDGVLGSTHLGEDNVHFGFTNQLPRFRRAHQLPDQKWVSVYPGSTGCLYLEGS